MKISHVVIKKRRLIRFRIVTKGNVATLRESNNENTTTTTTTTTTTNNNNNNNNNNNRMEEDV